MVRREKRETNTDSWFQALNKRTDARINTKVVGTTEYCQTDRLGWERDQAE